MKLTVLHPRWKWAILLLPLLLVLWGVPALVTVWQLRADSSANVGVLYRLAGLEGAIRHLERAGMAADESNLDELVAQCRQCRSALDRSEPRAEDIWIFLARIDDDMERVYDAVASHQAAPVAGQDWGRECFVAASDAVDEISAAVLAVRRRMTSISIALASKWTELYVLVVVGCVVGVLASSVFLLHRRESAARRRSEERFRLMFDSSPRRRHARGSERDDSRLQSQRVRIAWPLEERAAGQTRH